MQDTTAMVSVIVPVYNVEAYLRQCLDSLIGQSYQALEIILVNDGSTDQSGAICDEYARMDSRVRVFHKENDGSPSTTRNMGLEVAKGTYISFVDSDDWVEPEMYAELVSMMEARPHLSLIKFRAIKKPKHLRQRGSRRLKEYTSLRGYMQAKCDDVVWNALYRSECLQGIRFLNGIVCEDLHFTYRVFAQQELKFAVCNRRYYHYRAGRPGSIMSSSGLRLKRDMLILWKDLLERISDNKATAVLMVIANLRAMEANLLKAYARGRCTDDEIALSRDVVRKGWELVRRYYIEPDWDFPLLMLYIQYPTWYWLLLKPNLYIRGRHLLVPRKEYKN